MIIALGCDHGGYNLMVSIKRHLAEEGYTLLDFGSQYGEVADYSDKADKVTEAIQKGQADIGILICGTGVGISIAANKKKGIRCALVSDCYTARKTREHNDTNIIALGGRTIGDELAKQIVDVFLTTPFSNVERHLRRILKMDPYYKATPIR